MELVLPFQCADAYHVPASLNWIDHGPKMAEQESLARVETKEEIQQHQALDHHSVDHPAVPPYVHLLVLGQEKSRVLPSRQGFGFFCPCKIVSTGQDFL